MVSTRFLQKGAELSVPPCSPWWLPCGTSQAGSVPPGTALAGAPGSGQPRSFPGHPHRCRLGRVMPASPG